MFTINRFAGHALVLALAAGSIQSIYAAYSSSTGSLDWRIKGAVTPVKDQGESCHSSWAFAAVAAIEGAKQIGSGALISLSEQQIIDCSGTQDSAGSAEIGFQSVIDTGGIMSDSSYPLVPAGSLNSILGDVKRGLDQDTFAFAGVAGDQLKFTVVENGGNDGSAALLVRYGTGKKAGVKAVYGQLPLVLALDLPVSGPCTLSVVQGKATEAIPSYTGGYSLLTSGLRYPLQATASVESISGCGSGFCRFDSGSAVASVSAYTAISATENALGAAVDIGPVAVRLNVGASGEVLPAFRDYTGGIFSASGDDSVVQWVTVVGYGTENGVAYWIVKNSWGTGWGEAGYMRIKRNENVCGIADDGSYPVVN